MRELSTRSRGRAVKFARGEEREWESSRAERREWGRGERRSWLVAEREEGIDWGKARGGSGRIPPLPPSPSGVLAFSHYPRFFAAFGFRADKRTDSQPSPLPLGLVLPRQEAPLLSDSIPPLSHPCLLLSGQHQRSKMRSVVTTITSLLLAVQRPSSRGTNTDIPLSSL